MHRRVFENSHTGDKPLPTEIELERVTARNHTEEVSLQEGCIQELVAAQAARTPDAPALVASGPMLTYRQLDQQANRLAQYLRMHGANRGVLVALCLERSCALVVAALAVLKSGATYLPLDPGSPPRRLAGVLEDSRASLVLTQRQPARPLVTHQSRLLNLEAEAEEISRQPATPPHASAELDDIAYVIYTSGSTGTPKGVRIAHDSLLNLVCWHRRAFSVSSADRATLHASPGFDASVWEMWPYLTAGASLHLPPDAIRSDPEAFRDWLVAEKITITFLPTAMAERIMMLSWSHDTSLRFLLTGADMLTHYPRPNLPFTLVNNYGPTECTVVATSGIVPAIDGSKEPPSIGWPIANTQAYILDERLRPVPAGMVGELYIGGKGVARGYLNNPDLTRERFLPDPFSPRQQLYKTGDLARYLPDGQIAFLGRADDQIKIRGYRIEPGEIVAVLNRHPKLQASYVLSSTDHTGEKHLVAYVVPVAGARPGCRVLQDFLREYLPDYMIPTTFVPLAALPLNPSGKVDRVSLPPPDDSNVLRDQPASLGRTVVERRLAEMVAGLLQVPQVGIDDNFFLLGGNSLLGTQVIACVREAFGIDLSLLALFEAPTVAQLSAEIERMLYAKVESMSEDQARTALTAMTSRVAAACIDG